MYPFRNKASFYVVSTSPNLQAGSSPLVPLNAVRDYLFNIFAAALHIGGRSSIRKLKTRHAVVTGAHLSWLLPTGTCSAKVIQRKKSRQK